MPASVLPRFLCLYAAMFAAFGVASPFFPALLAGYGLAPSAIGLVLGLGTGIRIVAGPLGGRLADRLGAARMVLTVALAGAAVVATGYAPARGLLLLSLVSLGHAVLLAPLTPVADTLALGAADRPGGFEYGWVRGAGSAAFVLGNVLAGQAVGAAGLPVIIWLNAGLLAVAAGFAARVPNQPAGLRPGPDSPAARSRSRTRDLLRVPVFPRLMLVAALVGGSHALHDGFAVIRWQSAGVGPGVAGALWSESVVAEVLVFFVLGRPLLDRLGAKGAALLAAGAGVLRWGTAAQTASVPALALTQPLHGFTFALLHLTCMRVIARTVPVELSATAQAFYATVAMGATTTALTFAAGPLYGALGAGAFWAMAGLCAAALPVAYGLGDTRATGAAAAL